MAQVTFSDGYLLVVITAGDGREMDVHSLCLAKGRDVLADMFSGQQKVQLAPGFTANKLADYVGSAQEGRRKAAHNQHEADALQNLLCCPIMDTIAVGKAMISDTPLQ